MANHEHALRLHRRHAVGPPAPASSTPIEEQVVSAISGLRFGSVEIVVHDGKVVQIVRTEKMRVDR